MASQNALKRGTGWSGVIAELNSLEGSEAEDLNRGTLNAKRSRLCWGKVENLLRPGLLSTSRNRERRTTANEENDENRGPELLHEVWGLLCSLADSR
jgi:hypothetical protein